MGRSENRSYYWGLGIPFKMKIKYHFLYYTGIGVREVVLQLGNYSLVWEQLLKVYPKVNEYTVQGVPCLLTNLKIDFYLGTNLAFGW